MPIIDIQYRLRELGRLRLGVKGPKGAPQKLETWRLTSASRDLIDAAAEVYGGEVKPWEGSDNGAQYEVITAADSLDIVIPPGDAAFSQFYEMWSGGGCQRRCDGQRQYTRDVLCSCPAKAEERLELARQGKACKETTRFNVLLPRIPDIGVWRLEVHGYYAAIELAGVAQLLKIASDAGRMVTARLRLDQRMSKRPGQGTRRYIVPVVELGATFEKVAKALGVEDIDSVSVALPAPVEEKSFPGRAELPEKAAEWEVEDDGNGAEATYPKWVNDFIEHYGEPIVLDSVNDVRDAVDPPKPPVNGLQDVTWSNVNEATALLIAEAVKGRLARSAGSDDVGAGSEPQEGGGADTKRGRDASEFTAPSSPHEREQAPEGERPQSPGTPPSTDPPPSRIESSGADTLSEQGQLWRKRHLHRGKLLTCEEPRVSLVDEPCPQCGWDPANPNVIPESAASGESGHEGEVESAPDEPTQQSLGGATGGAGAKRAPAPAKKKTTRKRKSA